MSDIAGMSLQFRYRIEGVEFDDAVSSIVVSYMELDAGQGGQIEWERKIRKIDCRDEDLRPRLIDAFETLCDIIDEAHASRRHTE